MVTAKRVGNCKITITVKYRKTKNAKKVLSKKLTCKVTVKNVQSVKPTVKPTVTPTIVPTTKPIEGKNEKDVAALTAIIKEQKVLGATISEELDSEEYIWSKEGRLIGITWKNKELQKSFLFGSF